MRRRRALAALLAVLCLTLGACAAAGPTPTTAPPAEDQSGNPAAVLDQAREVAHQLEQREADLESMIP
jgi:outer membrane lipoprotein-sorting protein